VLALRFDLIIQLRGITLLVLRRKRLCDLAVVTVNGEVL
jgi:hypothetical protein